MKIKFLIGVSLLTGMTFSGFAQTNPFDYTIHGSLKNMDAIKSVYLFRRYSNAEALDSARVTGGHYEFKGTLVEPTQLYISASEKLKEGINVNNGLNIWVAKGDININSSGQMRGSTIDGTGAYIQKEFDKAFQRTNIIAEELYKLSTDPNFNDDKELQQKWKDGSYKLFPVYNFEMKDYLKKNPATPVSPILMEMIAGLNKNPVFIDSLLATLPEPNKSLATAKIADQLAKLKMEIGEQDPAGSKVAIGSKAVDFTQNDPEGKPVSLSSFKGKYVLIDFWASWCAPCRAENPNVVKAYQAYKNRGFEILGVSLDGASTKKAWLDAINHDHLSWKQVSDLNGWSNAAAKLYNVTGIPQNFLIDPNGVIVGMNLRGDELNKKLASIFK